MTKDKRKAWMRGLVAMPFSTDGTMTQETARLHRHANRASWAQPWIRDRQSAELRAYAEAMGWSVQRARAAVAPSARPWTMRKALHILAEFLVALGLILSPGALLILAHGFGY